MAKLNWFRFVTVLGLIGFYANSATGASNQAAYLSRAGSGTTCSLALPCSSMAAALTAAGSNGEVICLDKGAFGSVNIVQSVTISCGPGLWEAPAGTVDVNAPAGSDVIIEGLVGDSVGLTGTFMLVRGQGTLRLRQVHIGNMINSGSHAVSFAPSGGATLNVSDSVFYNNGGAGINVRPTAGGYANVHIRNTRFERNQHGFFVDGSASTIGVNVSISESMAVENQGNGIGAYSPAGGAPVTVSVKDSHISGNLTNGLGVLAAAASGAGSAAIAVGNTMITANVNGLSAGGAGQLRTHGNNQIQFNSNPGAFTANVGLQ